MILKMLHEPEYTSRLGEITHYNQLRKDNEIKVYYSLQILSTGGRMFNVKPPNRKNRKMKLGYCYANAIRRMKEGFEYVEGVITDKEKGFQISHAWNVDSEGNHIDFTIMDTAKYEYNGIIIPDSLLEQISKKNGKIWYCSLPYIRII
jgi:hypothetical protein